MLTIPGKIPIRIHPLFWMLVFLLGWINSEAVQPMFIWVAVILVSVLVHEFGHALTAVAFGHRAQIDLLAMGGLTSRQGPPLKLWQEFLIVLNGPLAGFSLYLFANYFLQQVGKGTHPYLTYTLLVATLVNFWWTIFNLIPIQPLDGGHLLSIILESTLGLRGVKIALFISMLLAGAAAGFFFLGGNLFMGSILLIFMYESYKNWKGSLVVTDQDRDSGLQQLFVEAERDASIGHIPEAVEKLMKVRQGTGKGVLYRASTQKLGSLYAQQGNVKEAIALLSSLGNKLEPAMQKLLQQLFFKTQELPKAIDYGTKVFQVSPDYEVALTNALSYGLQGDVKRAVGWLEAAIREGAPDLSTILARPEFDKIRHDPQFASIKTRS